MKLLITLLITLIVSASNISAQTTAFTYQGKLTDGGNAANGLYDISFKLFDTPTEGTEVGSENARDDVQVTNGIFTVMLNFGATPFALGHGQYLEIAVRPGTATGVYTTLSPRQPITSAPYAISTISADSLSTACVLCVTDAHIVSLDGNKVTGTVANAVTATNISGIVPIASGGTGSSTQSFVDLSSNQRRIGGDKEFTGAVSVIDGGRFFGDGSGLTNVNATIADGSVTTPKLADASVTAAKLAPDAIVLPASNLSLLGSLRWDLLKRQDIFAVGAGPAAVAFDGANMWVANYGAGTVNKLRAVDGANLGTFPVGPGASAIAFDGANVWTANFFSDSVTKLRASDGACVGTCTFPVGISPRGIAFDGVNIWVANNTSHNVTKLRASDGANQGTFAVGINPVGVAFDGAFIWVANQNGNSVTKLQASDGSSVATFPAGNQPSAIVFDGTNIWIANLNGSVTKLRNDGTSLGTFPSGSAPYAIAFDGANIWVANDGFANVTKLRASDGVRLGTFPVGTNPRGIAFDGTSMWTANSGLNIVTRLPPAFP